MDRLSSRMEMTEKMIMKLEDISIEVIQSEKQREKRLKKKKKRRTSGPEGQKQKLLSSKSQKEKKKTTVLMKESMKMKINEEKTCSWIGRFKL